MRVNSTDLLKLLLISLILLTVILNTANANEDEVDADFLEFLAEMEEVTGAGFDAWLNDADVDKNEDLYPENISDDTESTELQK